MWRLFRPLRYFGLRNKEKTIIDVVGTLVIALMILTPFLIFPEAPFFRAGGFLDRLIGLLSALTGFFVAALVAAATFAHPDLDREVTNGAVEMKVRDGKSYTWQRLTRRELACAIFGYLSFATFLLSVAAAMIVPIATTTTSSPWFVPPDLLMFIRNYSEVVRIFAMILVIVPLAHVMTATGLGIFYLMDRLHYRRPVIVSRADAA